MPNMRTGLAPQVTPGKRALAISVGETTGVSKLVKPGDRVDLIAVIGPKDGRVAKTILQDIVVLATGRAVSGNIARQLENDPYKRQGAHQEPGRRLKLRLSDA